VITIGRIPKIAQGCFRPFRTHFAGPVWGHFSGPVLELTVSHGGTIDRLQTGSTIGTME